MYEKMDFLNLKSMSETELKEAYRDALNQYDSTLEYTDYLEANPSITPFGKPVYALSVKEITTVLSNIERYITAICTYLDTFNEKEITEIEIVIPKKTKKRRIVHVLF